MKINDLYETQQDEGIGSALAKGVGAVSKGIGAVAGGARGAIDAAKQGYQAGRAAVSGQTPTGNTVAPATTATIASATGDNTTAPARNASAAVGDNTTAPAGNAAVGGTAPTTGAKGTADFGTIQRSIKTLSPNQKTALASQLVGKTPAATAPATPPPPAAPIGPQKGQEVTLGKGDKYRFMGQQWVEVDPASGAEMGGTALPAGFQKSLTDLAAKQAAAPAATDGAPNLRVVDGGKAAVAETIYFRSRFLEMII